MKKILLLTMVFISVFILGAKDDNLIVTSGTYLTSTADTAMWVQAIGSTVYAPSFGKLISSVEAAEITKRYVSIWIVDQEENVPLEKSLIYEKSMLWTDKTPDEIRADIPLNSLLEKHNKFRETLRNKEDKPLKKIRLRDLQIIIRNW